MGRNREGRGSKGSWGFWTAGLCTLLFLSACTGSSQKNFEESERLSLRGSVGDGPIVGAQIVVEDAEGQVVFTAESDAAANYQIGIPDGTYLPVTIRVSGGTDLVTGRGADFELLAVAFTSGDLTVNASPYTTLAAKTAQCMGGLSEANVNTAWQYIDANMNVGWDAGIIPNPMNEPIADGNIATVLVGNEALGEVIRRTAAALAQTTEALSTDEVMQMLACDLADGRLDGVGRDVSPRVALTLIGIATAVRVEVISGVLFVDGQDATALLDSALQTVLPGSTRSVTELAPNQQLIDQTLSGLAVLGTSDFPEATTLAIALEGATPDTARGQLASVLTSAVTTDLLDLGNQLALADTTTIENLLLRQVESASAAAPVVALDAEASSIEVGTSTRLSWAASDADECLASGGWSGTQSTSGTFQTPLLEQSTEYVLSCVGLGGTGTGRVFVEVTQPASVPSPEPDQEPDPGSEADPDPAPAPPPSPAPVVFISADRTTVDAGDSVLLTWNATDSESCTASGNWSGSRSVSGSLGIGPLWANGTYSLTCTGPGGSDSASVSITVIQPAPQPGVNLTAASTSVEQGSATQLNWTSTDATSCSASGAWSGDRAATGSASTGVLNDDSTFILTCSGPGGSASDSVRVLVTATPAPTVNLTAARTEIDDGDSTTLSWTSSNATSCTASGSWSGSRGTSGSTNVAPSATSTYTLTCSGAGGTNSASTTITVNPAPVPPPQVFLSVTPDAIDSGDGATLSWTSNNALSCTASGGWEGIRNTSGSVNVAPTATTTYSLTCSGDGGSDTDAVTLSVVSPAPKVTFSASETLVYPGDAVTVTWSSTDATGCTASGAWSGARSTSGSELVGPINSATTYTLTCTGPGGNAVEMLTVDTLNVVSLNWAAPAENVDGTPLTDLAGYRIYWGLTSRNYTDMVELNDPSTTSHNLTVASGEYFVAMTALNQDGNESGYSNEVLKTAR